MATKKLSLKDLDVKNKKVLLRVDFNVPLQEGKISDDTRIRAALPTITHILDQGGIPILMSHFGRPKGKKSPEFSLQPCADHLANLLGKKVVLLSEEVGSAGIKEKILGAHSGELFLLENLRFYAPEENPTENPSFAKQLADLGDVYVNDAFGAAHRAHASITELAHYFPQQAAAGFLLEKELCFLDQLLHNPKRPFYAILGGAKISSKFPLIQALRQKADAILIGGAMAYTFFKSQTLSVGASLVEEEYISLAQEVLRDSAACPLFLPVDVVVCEKLEKNSTCSVIDTQNGIPAHLQGVDIGPRTIKKYSQEIQQAATIFWNGPLGAFEVPPYDQGTKAIAQAIATTKAMSVIGGGDSVAAIIQAGFENQVSHISTGGGATLEYLATGSLVGIEALTNKVC